MEKGRFRMGRRLVVPGFQRQVIFTLLKNKLALAKMSKAKNAEIVV